MELEAYAQELCERVSEMEKATERLDKKVSKQCKDEVPMVSFLALEAERERGISEREELLERFENEKKDIRKHYKNIIMWVSIPLAIMIAGIFSIIIWFFSTYEVISYNQQTDYGHNNIVGRDGDVSNYEPAEDILAEEYEKP